jgi:hypothetical protein
MTRRLSSPRPTGSGLRPARWQAPAGPGGQSALREQGRGGVIPAPAAHPRGRTNRHVMTSEHAGQGQPQAVRRSLRPERSPRARCGSGAAWGCRTSCRMPLQSFAPGAGRNARQMLLPEAIEVPGLSRSPRKNAQFRSLSGNVSNGSSGRDRTVPRPQTRPRHICSSLEMLPLSSPRLERASHNVWLPPRVSRIAGGSHLRPVTPRVCQEP